MPFRIINRERGVTFITRRATILKIIGPCKVVEGKEKIKEEEVEDVAAAVGGEAVAERIKDSRQARARGILQTRREPRAISTWCMCLRRRRVPQ